MYCVVYTTHMIGKTIRKRREQLKEKDRKYSLRQVAQRVGLEPAYLSKIEREEVAPPSEDSIRKIALELDIDPDVLLAMAGKVSSDLLEIICKRPRLLSDLIRQLKTAPDHAILSVVREVKDGEW